MPSNPGIVIDIPTPVWTRVPGNLVDKWTSVPDIGTILRIDLEGTVKYHGSTLKGGYAGGYDTTEEAQTATELLYAVEDFWEYVKNNPAAQGTVTVNIPIARAPKSTISIGALGVTSSGNGAMWTRMFPDAIVSVTFDWEIPADIDATKDIKYQVVCTTIGALSNNTIKFKLSGYSVGHGDNIDRTFGTAVSSDLPSSTLNAYSRIVTDLSNDVSVTNLAANEVAMLKLERDPTDSFNSNVFVAYLRITYYKA